MVDPDQAPEGMSIRYGVSEALDEMKELYYGLPDLLRRVQIHEVSRLPLALQHLAHSSWSVVYVPQVGFLLQVEGSLLGADVLEVLPDIQLALPHSVSGGTDAGPAACYYTDTTRHLSERYGDVLPKIRDHETMICNNLAQKLIEYGGAVRAATDAASELDCLLSLAEVAVEMHLVRPTLSEENVLEIRGGRHLLAEAVISCGGGSGGGYIPNDTVMGPNSSRIHIITGPNLSGKSCYAKQVAIIVFLAHVGCFVPADAATIGLTDRIFTRVVTRESGAVPQSSFMIDLSQVAAMLRLATSRSLLIVDEFGKGTLAADGVGLLCGALSHLAARPCPPRVLLATHFTEVLNPQYLPRNEFLDFFTMSVTVADASSSDATTTTNGKKFSSSSHTGNVSKHDHDDDVVFLYRLTAGHVGLSFGVHCAALAGVQASVVDRAQCIIDCVRQGCPIKRVESVRMAEMTERYRDIVSQLLTLDLSSGTAAAAAVKALLSAAETEVTRFSSV